MEHYGVTRVADGAYYQRHSVSGGSVHVSGSMTTINTRPAVNRAPCGATVDRVVEEHEEPLGEAIRAAGLVHLARKKRGGLDASGRAVGAGAYPARAAPGQRRRPGALPRGRRRLPEPSPGRELPPYARLGIGRSASTSSAPARPRTTSLASLPAPVAAPLWSPARGEEEAAGAVAASARTSTL